MQHNAEARSRRIAIHREGYLEVRQLENRRCSQRMFQRHERRCCRLRLDEGVLAQELREGRSDGAEILDEAAGVARQPEEATETPR